MTTIATDGETIAADSLISCMGTLLAFNKKLHRCSDGRIFGCTGLATHIIQFSNWMLAGCPDDGKPILREEFAALVLNPDGSVDYMDQELTPVPYAVPAAVGSGGAIALGAMLAGATPAKAILIAAERDRTTGGTVYSERREGAYGETSQGNEPLGS